MVRERALRRLSRTRARWSRDGPLLWTLRHSQRRKPRLGFRYCLLRSQIPRVAAAAGLGNGRGVAFAITFAYVYLGQSTQYFLRTAE